MPPKLLKVPELQVLVNESYFCNPHVRGDDLNSNCIYLLKDIHLSFNYNINQLLVQVGDPFSHFSDSYFVN